MALRIMFNRNLGGSNSLYYCKCKAIVPRASFGGCQRMKSADDGDIGKKSVILEQMINNLGMNFQKKQMLKFKEKMSLNNNLNEISKVVTNTRPRTYLSPVTEDKDAARQITDLLNDDLLDDSLKLMETLAIDNRFPSRKCLLILASKCSAKGKTEGIRRVSKVCLIGFPQELSSQFEYQHYEAEALWKSGSIKKSLDLFYTLYVKHSKIRRKVVNMSSFCFCHVISENLTEHFSNVLNFVDLIANLNDLSPAANLWRHAFCSSLFEIQTIGEKLIDSYPKLFELLKLKVPTILKESRENFNADLFQRLMTLAIRFQWDDSYEIIFGEYLDYLCLMNDINGVKETLKYLDAFSMTLSAGRMEKCMALIAQSRNSSFSLKRIFKGVSPKKSPLKFEF